VTRYEQLVAAGRPQMLLTGDVGERNAAFHQVGLLWSSGLQTPRDSCSEFDLHSPRNVDPVQLLVGQAAIALTGVADRSRFFVRSE